MAKELTQHIKRGCNYLKEGKIKQAIKQYERALKIKPDDEKVNYYIALSFDRLGNKVLAREKYEKVIELNDKNYLALNNLGRIYLERGNSSLAIKLFNRASEINPDYSEVYYNLGVAYSGYKKQHKEAIEFYWQAIQRDRTNFSAYNNLALCLRKEGGVDEAIKYLKKAIKLKKDFYQAYFNLAAIYTSRRRYADAIRYYQKALEIYPNYQKAHYELGRIYYFKGDDKKAYFFFNTAKRLESKRLMKGYARYHTFA